MRLIANCITLCLVLAFIAGPTGVLAQTPDVVSTQPVQSALSASTSAGISVTFDTDMDATTINATSFVVNASSTGLHGGTITYDFPTRTATLIPLQPFFAGESITVALTRDITSSIGTPLANSYVWAFTTAVSNGSGVFHYTNDYHTGNNAGCGYPADLDGDGDIDIPTVDIMGSGYLSVMLNDGDGAFAWDAHYELFHDPAIIVSADFDKDGDMDIAASHGGRTFITTSWNQGDATFVGRKGYHGGDDIRGVIAADLDGDGRIDLASANTGSNNVSVFFNIDSAVFTPSVEYPVGDEPISICAADFDRDGDIDLATSNGLSNDVSVIMNNGDKTFGPDTRYSNAGRPIRIIAADLNGDGAPDLATVNWNSDQVGVLINNCTGGFADAIFYSVGDSPSGISFGDIDNDGDIDLLAANRYAESVSLLINSGNGTFEPQIVFPVGRQPVSVVCADLDGDGDLDFASGGLTSATLSVWLNIDALSVFSTQPVQNEPDVAIDTDISVTFSTDVDAATINSSSFVVHTSSTGQHDGTINYDPGTRTATFDPYVDFADGEVVSVILTEAITSTQGAPLTDSYCWSFTIEAGQCNGTYTDGPVYSLGNTVLNFICEADLNNDGHMDLVIPLCGSYSIPGAQVAVLISKGDGTFESQVDYTVASYPVNISTGDFNGDGFPDVVSINWFARNFSILYGDGTGALVSRADFPVGHTPNGITTADVNGDGHTDIITASRIYQNLGVFINDGTGAFGSPTFFPIGAPPLVIVSGDFDGDGDFDIATGNHGSTTVSILINKGDGSFESPAQYPSGGFRPGMIRAADYNGDGHLDIAAANYEDHNVGLLLNNGDGTFTLDAVIPTSLNPFGIDVGDIDGDGDPDLITTSRTENCASILINDNGTFLAPVNYPVGNGPRGIVASDLNGNGSLDLAIVSRDSPTVSVLWNVCEPGYTPAGSDIPIDLGDGLGLVFDNVITPGITEVTKSTQGPPPPTGFWLAPSAPPVYYEITTTAVFSGNITICFTYEDGDFQGTEKNLRILHRTGTPPKWERPAVSVDEVNNVVCAVVTTLSPFVLAEVVVPIALDIKPGSCPNPLNVGRFYEEETESSGNKKGPTGRNASIGRAVLPTAILGTESFDVSDIDPSTVRLEGVSPLRWSNEDVGAPIDANAVECECTTVPADGYLDLTLKFDVRSIADLLGEVYNNDSVALTLIGALYDGTLIEGNDCVVIHGTEPRPEDDPPETAPNIPATVCLKGNYPNPFNPRTSIQFSLPDAGSVRLEIFNIRGQKVTTLVDRQLGAGEHSIIWDGSEVASGIYLYRLSVGDIVETKKMTLLK